MAVSKAVCDLVYRRDQYQCVHCGAVDGLSLQHRINRGMGGSKYRDTPANLVVMCAVHNALLESDPALAHDARWKGWKLASWEQPTRCAVFYAPLGEWFLLDDDGGLAPADPVVPGVDDVPF